MSSGWAFYRILSDNSSPICSSNASEALVVAFVAAKLTNGLVPIDLTSDSIYLPSSFGITLEILSNNFDLRIFDEPFESDERILEIPPNKLPPFIVVYPYPGIFLFTILLFIIFGNLDLDSDLFD